MNREGFEPTALGLKIRCSDLTELPIQFCLPILAKGTDIVLLNQIPSYEYHQ